MAIAHKSFYYENHDIMSSENEGYGLFRESGCFNSNFNFASITRFSSMDVKNR